MHEHADFTQRTSLAMAFVAAITLTGIFSGCMSTHQESGDDSFAPDQTHFVINSSATLTSHLPSLGPISQTSLTQHMAFLQQWVDDTNSWFLPFAARYISGLNMEGQKRLLPVINKDPLIVTVNQRDVAVNLAAQEWQTLTGDDLTLKLRRHIIASALEKNVLLLNQSPLRSEQKKDEDEKQELVKAIYLHGIPTYISSFGIAVDDTPLSIALAGDRDFIEQRFDIIRSFLFKRKDSFEDPFADSDKNAPESIQPAIDQISLWICYKVEVNLGSERLIAAIAAGPTHLYEAYLETNPGIFMSLEAIPVVPVPLEGDSITH